MNGEYAVGKGEKGRRRECGGGGKFAPLGLKGESAQRASFLLGWFGKREKKKGGEVKPVTETLPGKETWGPHR